MKVLVVHPYHQHEFKLVKALKMAGHQVDLATTVYMRPHSKASLIAHIVPKKLSKRISPHRDNDIEDSSIKQFYEISGLIRLFLRGIPQLSSFHNLFFYKLSDKFAKRTAKYVLSKDYEAVVTYDNLSPVLFDILSKRNPHILRIMDVSSANIIYMKNIYDQDILLAQQFSKRLKTERAICWDEQVINRVTKEIKVTQKFLVPSNFVAQSLSYSGVKNEQVMICPYGVDITNFSPLQNQNNPELPLRFIYVGGVKEFKGVAYLFDAFMEIPSDKAILTVIGKYDAAIQEIMRYRKKINFKGLIMHSKMAYELQNADVFVLASLGEGLSLSAIEAAACGLPLIVTENSGINDLMQNGIEGFIIPIQSKEAIKEKVLWFVDHKEKVRTMGRAAREMATKHSWQEYENRIKELFRSLEDNESDPSRRQHYTRIGE